MISDDDFHHDSETFAVMLLPGWRHQGTGKLHIRRECRAVQFHRETMTPVLVRLDDDRECSRVFDPDALCGYCFAHLGDLAS